ncbi:hypothetical protein QLQ85_03405 [Halomonas sp. M4R5S39]|uniref:hypothetical protein n=1 Tax=Halomonas kalidii TaxID=3043293 RepID=UPI0024A8EF9F|nr:hypothetical protein [Halomonas kalidii]MDI5983826.1 hypothetical protein [Halomonas kalidii]
MQNTNKGCGCSKDARNTKLDEEYRKSGRKSILSQIEREAREALASLPGEKELEKTSKIGRQLIGRLSDLYVSASLASKWEDEELEAFINEMAWVKHVCDVQVSYMDNSDRPGASGSKNCVKVYDECIDNHGCDDSGWFCVCCAPCSIKYSKCILTGGLFEMSSYNQFA